MGFEDMAEEKGLTPIHGVMELPLPKTLSAAASMLCDKHSIYQSEEVRRDERKTRGREKGHIVTVRDRRDTKERRDN